MFVLSGNGAMQFSVVFFFLDASSTVIYTLSLHDALPIFGHGVLQLVARDGGGGEVGHVLLHRRRLRSEEHTSELQSHSDLVCRLLLEKKTGPQPRPGHGRKARLLRGPPLRLLPACSLRSF